MLRTGRRQRAEDAAEAVDPVAQLCQCRRKPRLLQPVLLLLLLPWMLGMGQRRPVPLCRCLPNLSLLKQLRRPARGHALAWRRASSGGWLLLLLLGCMYCRSACPARAGIGHLLSLGQGLPFQLISAEGGQPVVGKQRRPAGAGRQIRTYMSTRSCSSSSPSSHDMARRRECYQLPIDMNVLVAWLAKLRQALSKSLNLTTHS